MLSSVVFLDPSGILYVVSEQLNCSRMGLSAPCPTTSYPGGPMFSVGGVSLSCPVPILKGRELAFCPYITWPYKSCPGAMTWTCIGLSRNIRLYSSFTSMPLSAGIITSFHCLVSAAFPCVTHPPSTEAS